ncbi:MAG TPA: alcohol dehydrogenase, partial [Candidatus Atribacteria bacterium]|nr:alcohol dehydrogenase [Candidatus Atribacteria bacterium]
VVVEASNLVKKMGEIILLGTPRAEYETDITPLLRVVHLNWVTLKGALEWCFPLYDSIGSKYSFENNSYYIFDLIKEKRLVTDGLITHVIKPTEFKEAYEGLLNKKDEYLGVLIDWT